MPADSDPTQLLTAAVVAPMNAAVLREAAVAIRGNRIVSLGSIDQLRRAHPDALERDLRDCVLLPGLVNAHVHLELSGAACGDSPGGSFTDWITSVRERSGIDVDAREQSVAAAVRAGVEQCLRFGVTCVGDISNHTDLVRPVLRNGPLRAVSYGEALGLAGLSARFEAGLQNALNTDCAGERLKIGLSPHAPYTVDLPGYRRCLEIARAGELPLATHLAETRDEREFLESQTGPFREVWERLGLWTDGVETFRDGGPINLAQFIGLLDYPLALLAHVNYCDDLELALLARGRASVVFCPRTHRYFGHPPHRWREMLARGLNVAAGTDSCASSPDLNLVDELRLLHRLAPEVPAATLWSMVTIRAARALGLDDTIGSLTPNRRADLVAFPVSGSDPLVAILENAVLPKEVWLDGESLTRPRSEPRPASHG